MLPWQLPCFVTHNILWINRTGNTLSSSLLVLILATVPCTCVQPCPFPGQALRRGRPTTACHPSETAARWRPQLTCRPTPPRIQLGVHSDQQLISTTAYEPSDSGNGLSQSSGRQPLRRRGSHRDGMIQCSLPKAGPARPRRRAGCGCRWGLLYVPQQAVGLPE
jgi:hypothetical protein